MPDQEVLARTAEAVDRLVTVEVRGSAFGRGHVVPLYEAGRALPDGSPLSLRAARLLARLEAGATAFLVTGTGDPETMPCGETDGPPGAAALASVLRRGMGVLPVLLTEAEHLDNLAAVCRALGLEPSDGVGAADGGCVLLPLAADESAAAQAAGYLERFRPQVLVAVEKLAPNRAGVAHRATGLAAATGRARAEVMVGLVRRRGIATIGIGDNGNEIGFGSIEDAVRRANPLGRRCCCPCGVGIASHVATDVLVVANVSNWGAYAVEAVLGQMLGRPELVHSPDDERRMLEASVASGGVDADGCRPYTSVDGLPLEVHQAVVELLGRVAQIDVAARLRMAP